ncbi:MAG TPA: cytochrome c oxidase assembly protein [Longimicrobiales bacterium]
MIHGGVPGLAVDVPIVPATALVATAVLYARGAGPGERGWRAAAFVAGWLAAGLALASPLHAAGGVRLTAHMLQHVLLISVAAPLLVWSRPVGALLRGLPGVLRRPAVSGMRSVAPVRRRMTGIVAACVIQAIVLWAWHLPGLYEAGLRYPLVHWVQHVTLVCAALAFWASIPLHTRAGHRMTAGIASLFITTLQMGVLSALFTFSTVPWYDTYFSIRPADALGDQQVAGLIMWVPGSLPYIAAALALLWRLVTRPDVVREDAPVSVPVLHQPITQHALRTLAILVACVASAAFAAGCDGGHEGEAAAITGGDPQRGKVLIARYGCISCHEVPGVPGGAARVGPPLAGIRNRAYVAGVLTNSPDNIIRFIRDPQAVDSLTAMPDLGVTDAQARDIASYLYSR